MLLDGAPGQIELRPRRGAWRGIIAWGRRGAAWMTRAMSKVCWAFQGVGLRPYAPVHLRAVALGGDLALGWVRRTRIDGDSWEGIEGAARRATEGYLLRIRDAGGVVREEVLSAPSFTYTAAMRGADAPGAPFTIEVAQLSRPVRAGAICKGSGSMD